MEGPLGESARLWHEGSVSEIPSTDTVLIADDAHLYDDLDKIIGLISSRAGPEPRLKLVIATRPSGIGRIDEMLARLASSTAVVRFKKLPIISRGATAEIAKEVLGPVYQHLADQLAWVSRDTPLITVVGGKLMARGQITPDLLLNDKDFRREVFSKFHEERTGELPASGRPKNVLLSLIAAVQPSIRTATTSSRGLRPSFPCVRTRSTTVSTSSRREKSSSGAAVGFVSFPICSLITCLSWPRSMTMAGQRGTRTASSLTLRRHTSSISFVTSVNWTGESSTTERIRKSSMRSGR